MRRCAVALSVLLIAPSLANAQASPWSKLMARMQMDRERLTTRTIAMGMACDMADAAGAAQLVTIASAWADEIDQAALTETEPAQDSVLATRRELICALVCSGGSHLNAVGDPTATLALWTRAATRSWIGQDVKETAFQLIADNPCPQYMRQAAALAALRDSGVGRSGRLPQAFKGLFDASAVPAFRMQVAEYADPETFNFTAAAVLAESGDTTILPYLQDQHEIFASAGARYGRALEWYAWQVQVQNPPEALLAHIASEQLFTSPSRCWAIRRAAELGLSADQIRQAILQYAVVGRPFGPEKLAAGIAKMKAVGAEVGVLAPTDLPEVQEDDVGLNDDVRPTTAWQVSTPSVNWQPPWEPRYENFDVFFEWMESFRWQSLSEEDGSQLFRQRLCELELIPPGFCHSSEQPSDSGESSPQ